MSGVLAGHVVLVTGAAGTLGRAIAAAIRDGGGTVLATDLRSGDGIAPVRARQTMAGTIALRRLARPAEVAAAVVHLLSPASAFTTGAEIAIDGGLTAA